MSLQNFHVFFITLSVLLCIVFGAWCIQTYRAEGDAGTLAMGTLSFVAAVGLVGYGAYFIRKVRRVER
jgi:hypothetical protein